MIIHKFIYSNSVHVQGRCRKSQNFPSELTMVILRNLSQLQTLENRAAQVTSGFDSDY